MSKHIKPWNPLLFARTSNQHPDQPNTTSNGRLHSTLAQMSRWHCCWWMDCAAALQLQNTPRVVLAFFFARPTAMEDAAVNRPAKSITQLTLCQVTTDEVDAATKLLDKACQKLRGIPDVPSQRITDLEAAIRQMRQLSCILDSCTISFFFPRVWPMSHCGSVLTWA